MKIKLTEVWGISLLLVIPLILFLFVKNEIVIAIILVTNLLISFRFIYYKNEWKLFFVGGIFGFIIEILGDFIYKLQYWENGSLFGIPLWLPIMWGYITIILRRIGNWIVK